MNQRILVLGCLGLFLGFFTVSAQAAEMNLNCEGIAFDDMRIAFHADEIQPALLLGVEAIVEVRLPGDEAQSFSATRDELQADKKYKPRKYKNYYRFDLTKLKPTSGRGQFRPAEDCKIQVMLPKAMKPGVFYAPMTLSCDQSGTTSQLQCLVREAE